MTDEISAKEKNVQIALGTWNIPELIPVDLHKTDKYNNHPDLEEDTEYLVSIRGEYRIGNIDSFTKKFYVGPYEETITDCSAIWLIKGRE